MKETLRTRGSLTSASPKPCPFPAPGPVTTDSTPSGSPASVKHRARASAVSGVVLAGLSTIALPAASAVERGAGVVRAADRDRPDGRPVERRGHVLDAAARGLPPRAADQHLHLVSTSLSRLAGR